jgi:hypothetical protein
MGDWRSVIKDPREVRMFESLEDPKFDWRTVAALKRESGLSDAEVLKVIALHPELIRQGKSGSGEPIWTLQERYWKRPGLTQFLDFMSNTSTSSSST